VREIDQYRNVLLSNYDDDDDVDVDDGLKIETKGVLLGCIKEW